MLNVSGNKARDKKTGNHSGWLFSVFLDIQFRPSKCWEQNCWKDTDRTVNLQQALTASLVSFYCDYFLISQTF